MIYVCKGCGRTYYYDVKKCIFCGSEISEVLGRTLTVKGSTKVMVPSPEHKQVPYHNILLEDEKGNLYLEKSLREHNMGDKFEKAEKGREKKISLTLGVVGTGVTGVGIAETALLNGFRVILVSRTKERIGRITSQIRNFLAKSMDIASVDKMMGNYLPSTEIDGLNEADIIIESVTEDKKIKDDYFKRIDRIAKKDAIIATNTSSLSVDELSESIKDKSRMLGMHFFNPVPRMALIEIVKGRKTSEKTLKTAVMFAEALGKAPVVMKDSPCFIVNRVMVPYLNEAAKIFEEGVASKEDIDKAVRLGLNHPMGPLSLMDLIGLDVVAEIMNNLYKSTKDRKYVPAGIITEMVKKGKLGRKTGEGFFRYD